MNTSEIFILRSLTVAIKAQRLLSSSGYTVKIVKQASKEGEGCKYGIRILKGSDNDALLLLEQSGISSQRLTVPRL